MFGIAANRHLKKTLRLFEVPISISKNDFRLRDCSSTLVCVDFTTRQFEQVEDKTTMRILRGELCVRHEYLSDRHISFARWSFVTLVIAWV